MNIIFKNKKAHLSSQYFRNKQGITTSEILIVFAVVGILVAIVIPQFSVVRDRQVLKASTEDVLSSINKAKSQTLASTNSLTYGVYFQSDKVVIFQGTVYSASDSNNEVINIISPASITNVTLNGASSTSGEFYFNRIYGAPSKTGTVTISTSNTKIITIYQSGNISVN